MKERLDRYFAELASLPARFVVTDGSGQGVAVEDFFARSIELARAAHDAGRKLMFVGNGGSSTIASHMAEDFTKSVGIRALAFNDPAFITCLGNDLGFETIFEKQIEMFAQAGDVLVAISSSGNSENILRAAAAARAAECTVLTLSGFGADNALRRLGDLNLYVPCSEYGFVEVTHSAACHALARSAG